MSARYGCLSPRIAEYIDVLFNTATGVVVRIAIQEARHSFICLHLYGYNND